MLWKRPATKEYLLYKALYCNVQEKAKLTHDDVNQNSDYLLGADCGSDHELIFAKFRLTLKKLGKTTRLFRYDLNQIPYNYTVELRNRFKGLDLIQSRKNDEPRGS